MEFYPVRAAKKGLPTVTNSGGRMTIKMPDGFLARHGLDPSSRVKILFGAANKKAALRVTKDPDGDWGFVTYRKSHHLRIPELVAKAEYSEAPLKARSVDGGLEFELPAPWELVDQSTVETA